MSYIIEDGIELEDGTLVGEIYGVLLTTREHLMRSLDLSGVLLLREDDGVREMLSEHLPIAYLKNVRVEEEFRGEGDGSALVSWFISEAIRLGAKAIILESDLSNKNEFDLTEWYASYGFEELDTFHYNPIMLYKATT